MNVTPRLSLPFLSTGQAQKEFTHNEALQTLDVVCAAAVEEPPMIEPPLSPSFGSCYLVASSPTGDWAGKEDNIAAFTSGGWRYVAPTDGMSVYVKSSGTWANYRLGTWEIGLLRGAGLVIAGEQVVSTRAAAIASVVGGSTIDSEARIAIDQILAALRHHGLIEL
jgi:hypothetical protein